MKYCKRCTIELTTTNWREVSKKNRDYLCIPCDKKRQVLYYATHRKERQQRQRAYIRGLKVKVLRHYGHKCKCCGEGRYEFLTIDHINNDGARHRKHKSAKNWWLWIIRNNYPTDLQLLCWNCNCSRGCHGYCPHDDGSLVVR